MNASWWPWHRLADPYYYSSVNGERACNCTPPALVTVEQVDAYMGATLKATAWTALNATQKAQALNSAQTALRTLRWCTDEATCCGNSLTAGYLAAASELALVLFNNSTAVIGASSQLPAPVVKREKFDVFEQEYFDPSTIAQVLPKDKRVGSYSPTVLRLYPWLLDLIGCWVDRQNESSVRILRG